MAAAAGLTVDATDPQMVAAAIELIRQRRSTSVISIFHCAKRQTADILGLPTQNKYTIGIRQKRSRSRAPPARKLTSANARCANHHQTEGCLLLTIHLERPQRDQIERAGSTLIRLVIRRLRGREDVLIRVTDNRVTAPPRGYRKFFSPVD